MTCTYAGKHVCILTPVPPGPCACSQAIADEAECDVFKAGAVWQWQ